MHRAEKHQRARYYATAAATISRSRVAFTTHRALISANLSAWKLAGKDGRKPHESTEYTPIVKEGAAEFEAWALENHFRIDWETLTLISYE